MKRWAWSGALLLAVGCGSDFSDYNQLEDFRVLALRSDPPALGASATATVSALLYDGENARYRWRWCPLLGGADAAYECALSEAALEGALAAEGIDVDLPSFELGTSSTAQVPYPGRPELLRGLCAALTSGDVPEFVVLPDCEESFPIQITLEVEANGKEIRAVKELPLLLAAPAGAHENPAIDTVYADVPGRTEMVLSATQATELPRAEDVKLRITLPADAAESTGEDEVEELLITWFVEGGETEYGRTAYRAGELDLEDAVRNEWRTPTRADYAESDARLYIVIRDDRGGTGWIQREIRWVDGPAEATP